MKYILRILNRKADLSTVMIDFLSQEIKGKVDALIRLVQTNAELEEMEKPLRELGLNVLFFVNQG